MSMDETWCWKGINKTTEAWRLSKRLFTYLKNSGYKVTYSPSASDVQKGDVVFYWTNGGWGHVAICVGKNKDGKPLVNAYNDPHYHFSYWTMGYKTCVISMQNGLQTPTIQQDIIKNGKRITITNILPCTHTCLFIVLTVIGSIGKHSPDTDFGIQRFEYLVIAY